MEDQEEPFAAFVLRTLTRQSAELERRWTERVELATADSGDPDSDHDAAGARSSADGLVRTLLGAAATGVHRHELLIQASTAIGANAHRRNAPLYLMLREVDLLEALLLRATESVAAGYPASVAGHEGFTVARRIAGAASQLRLAAVAGYTQAIEDELRERYRMIRHDLRNPLGTIKSAVALLTDESAPAEMRKDPYVRAMVVRNTSSLDQLIGEALGDAAARLPAFGTSQEPAKDLPSGREQGDDVARTRERSDLEPGTF